MTGLLNDAWNAVVVDGKFDATINDIWTVFLFVGLLTAIVSGFVVILRCYANLLTMLEESMILYLKSEESPEGEQVITTPDAFPQPVIDRLDYLPRIADIRQRMLLESKKIPLLVRTFRTLYVQDANSAYQITDLIYQEMIKREKYENREARSATRTVDLGIKENEALAKIRIKEREEAIKQDLMAEIPRFLRDQAEKRGQHQFELQKRLMDSIDSLNAAIISAQERLQDDPLQMSFIARINAIKDNAARMGASFEMDQEYFDNALVRGLDRTVDDVVGRKK